MIFQLAQATAESPNDGALLWGEGWFAMQQIPQSWVDAGPTSDGLKNFVGVTNAVGPGLGTEGMHPTLGFVGPEELLDKIDDVTPLRAEGLELLRVGDRQVCAIVWQSDPGINYLFNGDLTIVASLKGKNLGIVAFTVDTITPLASMEFPVSMLPEVELTILDPVEVCGGNLALFMDAPMVNSSSDPFDVVVGPDPVQP